MIAGSKGLSNNRLAALGIGQFPIHTLFMPLSKCVVSAEMLVGSGIQQLLLPEEKLRASRNAIAELRLSERRKKGRIWSRNAASSSRTLAESSCSMVFSQLYHGAFCLSYLSDVVALDRYAFD